jgi:hypothetical protein
MITIGGMRDWGIHNGGIYSHLPGRLKVLHLKPTETENTWTATCLNQTSLLDPVGSVLHEVFVKAIHFRPMRVNVDFSPKVIETILAMGTQDAAVEQEPGQHECIFNELCV